VTAGSRVRIGVKFILVPPPRLERLGIPYRLISSGSGHSFTWDKDRRTEEMCGNEDMGCHILRSAVEVVVHK